MSPRDIAHLLMDRFNIGGPKCPGAARSQPNLHSMACSDITKLLEDHVGWPDAELARATAALAVVQVERDEARAKHLLVLGSRDALAAERDALSVENARLARWIREAPLAHRTSCVCLWCEDRRAFLSSPGPTAPTAETMDVKGALDAVAAVGLVGPGAGPATCVADSKPPVTEETQHCGGCGEPSAPWEGWQKPDAGKCWWLWEADSQMWTFLCERENPALPTTCECGGDNECPIHEPPGEDAKTYAAHDNAGPPLYPAESCNQRGCPWHGERVATGLATWAPHPATGGSGAGISATVAVDAVGLFIDAGNRDKQSALEPTPDEPQTCIKCKKTEGRCTCTGGPQFEPECTCYEVTGGHQPGCYFNRRPEPTPTQSPEALEAERVRGVLLEGLRLGRRQGLTFGEFGKANRERCESPSGFGRALDSTNIDSWGLAICGEAGEIADTLYAIGHNPKKGLTLADVLDEVADVVSYCDLMAQRLGSTLEACLMAKWNRVSEKRDYPGRLTPQPADDSAAYSRGWEAARAEALLAVLGRIRSARRDRNRQDEWSKGWNGAVEEIERHIEALSPLPSSQRSAATTEGESK